MHIEVQDFVFKQFHNWRSGVENAHRKNFEVLEIGSLDINGSIKSIFTPFASDYVGIDVQEGPGVDIVADATTYVLDEAFDIIVCCEVFEHLENWKEVVYNSFINLKSGGIFIGTCAGEGRPPHSAIDEKPIRSHEYYQNVGNWNMTQTLEKAGFDFIMTETDKQDLRWVAIK